jgi:putative endonuclease
MFYVYFVKCRDNSFYCGYTSDLNKRVATHNSGAGAKYTKKRRPVTLIYSETFDNRKDAMKRECALKKLSRKQKEALIFKKY